jgi:hypothetical protein
VLWSVIALVVTGFEKKTKSAEIMIEGRVSFPFLVIWLLSDLLALVNWLLILFFMFFGHSNLAAVLIATASLYCVTILLRIIASPFLEKDGQTLTPLAGSAAAGLPNT